MENTQEYWQLCWNVRYAVAAFSAETGKNFEQAFPEGTVFNMQSHTHCVIGQALSNRMLSCAKAVDIWHQFLAFCNDIGDAEKYIPIWQQMYPMYTFTN